SRKVEQADVLGPQVRFHPFRVTKPWDRAANNHAIITGDDSEDLIGIALQEVGHAPTSALAFEVVKIPAPDPYRGASGSWGASAARCASGVDGTTGPGAGPWSGSRGGQHLVGPGPTPRMVPARPGWEPQTLSENQQPRSQHPAMLYAQVDIMHL